MNRRTACDNNQDIAARLNYTEWRRDHLEQPGDTLESVSHRAMEAYKQMNDMMKAPN